MSSYGSMPPSEDPNQPYGQQPYGQQPYGQQPYGQPGGYGQPAGAPPPSNLVWAILSTLFCCLPLGIVSIVYAAQVNSKWTAGDYAGAQASSGKAKKFAIYSAVTALVLGILYVVLVVALGLGGGTMESDY